MTTSVNENEIKQLIIESLFLEDIEVDDIKSDEALFGDGLGLDSIDALELGIALQNKYGLKISEGKFSYCVFISCKNRISGFDSFI